MINIDPANKADAKLDEFESIVPNADDLLEELFVRFLGTDEVYYYYENSKYIFYPDPHFSNLRHCLYLKFNAGKTAVTVQYLKDDSDKKPTVVTKFVFDKEAQRFVEAATKR